MSSTLIEVIASPVLACSVGLFFGPCASGLTGFRKSAHHQVVHAGCGGRLFNYTHVKETEMKNWLGFIFITCWYFGPLFYLRWRGNFTSPEAFTASMIFVSAAIYIFIRSSWIHVKKSKLELAGIDIDSIRLSYFTLLCLFWVWNIEKYLWGKK